MACIPCQRRRRPLGSTPPPPAPAPTSSTSKGGRTIPIPKKIPATPTQAASYAIEINGQLRYFGSKLEAIAAKLRLDPTT